MFCPLALFQNFGHNYPLKVCCRNTDDLLGDPYWVLSTDGKTKVFCLKPCRKHSDCPNQSKCVNNKCIEGIYCVMARYDIDNEGGVILILILLSRHVH